MLKPGEAAAIREWVNTTRTGMIVAVLLGGAVAGVLSLAIGSGVVLFISAFIDLN